MSTDRKKQRGYANMDFSAIFWLAGIGLIALVVFVLWAVWWLFTNVSITIGG